MFVSDHTWYVKSKVNVGLTLVALTVVVAEDTISEVLQSASAVVDVSVSEAKVLVTKDDELPSSKISVRAPDGLLPE